MGVWMEDNNLLSYLFLIGGVLILAEQNILIFNNGKIVTEHETLVGYSIIIQVI